MLKLFSFLWQALTSLRQIVANLLFLALVIIVVSLYLSREVHPIPANTALVLDPAGTIVEQRLAVDPFNQFLSAGQDTPRETLLKDLLDAIRFARDDDRIRVIVLDLDQLRGSTLTSLSKLQEIGAALLDFRASGKQVFAYGTGYDQDQYYLAAHADRIYLQKIRYGGMGVFFEGLGIYPTFFYSALQKLRAEVHVFRVGTFKSAVEPYTRDDMSDESRAAFQDLLGTLWTAYKREIAAQRTLVPEQLDQYIAHYDEILKQAGSDVAKLALEQKLVDEVVTSAEWVNRVSAVTGKRGNGFPAVRFSEYLADVRPAIDLPDPRHDKVAVLIAKGDILDGKQPPGYIGGETASTLIRQVRDDDTIKALVLRVDSGGGSAFASEMIRGELELLKGAGKPVVVSMGSVAASGGYWISAGADRIFASPSTITGSIGIFGVIPTFERSADALGIHVDGVGTEPLSGSGDLLRPLNPMLERTIQQLIEEGYRRFVEIVAQGRGLSAEEVDRIGQGRVWSGSEARELGLVDEFGDLHVAIAEAADLAGIESWDEVYLEPPVSTRDRILNELFGNMDALLGRAAVPSAASRWIGGLTAALGVLERMNDPRGIYLQCFSCSGY